MIGNGMSAVEALKSARLKIAGEKHWTKEVAARDSQGHSIDATDKSAVCWCSLGALAAVTKEKYPFSAALLFLYARMENEVAKYNDFHEHAEVLAAWDAAIADAETAVTA